MLSARSEALSSGADLGSQTPDVITAWHGGGKPKSVTSSPDPRPQPPQGTETDLRAGGVRGHRGR